MSVSPGWFKVIFVAADLLTLALLRIRVKTEAVLPARRLVSTSAAACYAWNPAVVYAFAGAAHYDSLMVLALTAAAVALHLSKGNGAAPRPRSDGCWWAGISALCLGAAIALKLVPILLLPVWAFALGARVWMLATSLVVPGILALPFGGWRVVLAPFRAFADVARFNELLVWIFPNPWQRNWPVTVLLAATVAVLAWWLRNDWRRSLLWVLGAALILSPVLHPWYVTWILPFAIWRRQPAWTVLSISALAAFLLWETTPLWHAWQPNLLTRALVLVPPILAWRYGGGTADEAAATS